MAKPSPWGETTTESLADRGKQPWKYVWIDNRGIPRRGFTKPERYDAVYVPSFIWESDDAIKNYFERLPRVGAILKSMIRGTESPRAYTPSPFASGNQPLLEEQYRRQYQGQFAMLDDKPARVIPIEGGRAAAIIGPSQSGEASWSKVHEVMTQRRGEFRLERGHLAI